MREMMIDENKKKKEMNEKILTDLCECCLTLGFDFSFEFLSICVPCLLKAALKKEENEETQMEVEMALFALSSIGYCKVPKEMYLSELKEIIQYHQEHHNLTQLAYQSAWQFLIRRILCDRNLEDVIVNELHFGREAARELKELTRNVDWKRGKEEEKEKETKEVIMTRRWIDIVDNYLIEFTLWKEEFVVLICSVVQVFRAAKDNNKEIRNQCIYLFRSAAFNWNMKVEDLLKGGAVDAVLEEMKQSTLDDEVTFKC
ncbi:uncharacterized protein MONOS_14022 [Monocercomonoides exilis]|uniref:uncharacterized protein n=1 Tax=Monocercomonoides exilis TaxID=2049356 RepID=UPI003559F3BC|nr:hypothetical protein MONOS_14022 [Monocercomonoides exilis]|eukprot:MONOS_14022.1-p1 / transcript=MONOS_14022.1 / gene=MONOS_14022 / organism=Monocercomonoides_exilis_PA203 / gene_product=unspecified product / transcript_product=unspecified product / location=Mono_scaffold00922:21731-22562(-) / protein_length=258 / sequence_SO=supercontig / SO=protein_coding / is_pseudo=false